MFPVPRGGVQVGGVFCVTSGVHPLPRLLNPKDPLSFGRGGVVHRASL